MAGIAINIKDTENDTEIETSTGNKTFEPLDEKVFKKTSGDWTHKAVERMLEFHNNRDKSVDPETIRFILENPAPFLKAMIDAGDNLKQRWNDAKKKLEATGLDIKQVMSTRDDSGFDPAVIPIKKTLRYLLRLIDFIGYTENGPGSNPVAPIYVWLASNAAPLNVKNPFKAVDAQIRRSDSILKGILG